jgi:Zn2+/Cd2+-exporting ATPase
MITKKYTVKGFDCANCALHAEDLLNKNEKIEKASINFLASKLEITYKDKVFSNKELNVVINKISDDHLVVTEEKDSSPQKTKIFNKEVVILISRIVVSSILLLIGVFAIKPFAFTLYSWQWILMLCVYILSYLIISYDHFIKFFRNVIHFKNVINESLLMLIASLGAFCIQEYPEAILVMILAQIGEVFEEISVNQSKNSIIDTIDTRPKTAIKLVGDKRETVHAKELNVGDIILIRVGDVIPNDGEVINGEGDIDVSSIIGEFVPVHIVKDSKIMSGSVLKSGSIDLKVTATYEDSTTSKILTMAMESNDHKSKAENFIDKFARLYVPIIFGIALITAVIPPLFICGINGTWTWEIWYKYIYSGLTILVIGCPCAIVISVPLAYFMGIGLASKNGIIIKGSNYLDRINEISEVVMDKTGTLTTGQFSVVNEHYENIDKDTFHEILYIGESNSTHPIAKAIVDYVNIQKPLQRPLNFKEKGGLGVSYEYNNKVVLIGSIALLKKNKVDVYEVNSNATILYVSLDGSYVGYVELEDTPKENSKTTIAYLSSHGIKTLMLTGGKASSAQYMADYLGIEEYHADLLPEDKISYLENEISLRNKKQAVAFVGDGINDSPSIILSDVGFAMGALGSEAAIQNADVVLMNDDPKSIVTSIKVAKITRNKSIFNIIFALLIKASIMVLSFIPSFTLPMWIAVLSDTGLSMLLIINSILIIRRKVK